MQQEKDYIKKEVNKIISLLKKIIQTLFSTEEIFTETINEVNKDFESYFEISIFDALSLKEEEFISKFKEINSSILEQLIKLFLEIKKTDILTLSKSEIDKKIILLINLIDEKEKTFSFERMQLKNKLT